MGMLQLVEKGTNTAEKVALPSFYMNDFSVLGVVVNQLDRAVAALKKKGFLLQSDELGATWIHFNGKDSLQGMLESLKEEEISYTFSDVVSCAYQG
ncbi:MAG: hypothetical protein CSA32_00065 [Desulfobulbus propionicus]|nr:MAG: hypothetical protein CSA32_00065 [Desulfobulbus propionicus]